MCFSLVRTKRKNLVAAKNEDTIGVVQVNFFAVNRNLIWTHPTKHGPQGKEQFLRANLGKRSFNWPDEEGIEYLEEIALLTDYYLVFSSSQRVLHRFQDSKGGVSPAF